MPLDQNARIVVNSTPAFARMVSWKYANMAAPQVEDDLLQNHRRTSSRATLKDLSDVVACIAQAKKNTGRTRFLICQILLRPFRWDWTAQLYSIGMATTARPCVGTISLLNSEGERLHTTYCAAAPEYGKQTFIRRFTGEIQKIKKRFPEATYVGVADGAPDNWTFLEPFVSYQVLDFYHVSEYVADAAEALFPGVRNKDERKSWMKQKLHSLKHEKGAAHQLSEELRDASPGNNRTASLEKLYKARTYFKNNWKKMIYPEALDKHLPLGSGVTEAACKILVSSECVVQECAGRKRELPCYLPSERWSVHPVTGSVFGRK